MALRNTSSANQGRVVGNWTDLFAQKRREELNSLDAEQDAVDESVYGPAGGPPNPIHLKAFNSFEVRVAVSSQAGISDVAPEPAIRAPAAPIQLSSGNPFDYETGLQDPIEAVTASNVLAALRQARRLGRPGDAAYENGDMLAFGIAEGRADRWPVPETNSWEDRDGDSNSPGSDSGDADGAEKDGDDWEPPTTPTYRQAWEWQDHFDEVDGEVVPSGEDGGGKRRGGSEDDDLNDGHYPQ
ncbi:hypothetical protein LTR56_015991 [Elasticomyces elasticus]|nr:hypothetical protein LTR22_025208 [Elasticomyces elasticus]KAK3633077.1 hypothetical protein LTR56_015991 [Elasticomyces elasticus]KAK4917931.1 hypothetical protein LTR49_014206 [Elasticomyces elasticus]KAK5753327.1 hypothetical protein LTS12_016570 [Elasticomyces elasticus]